MCNSWDKKHIKYYKGKINYDNWLDNYNEIIKLNNLPIVDLGCGIGNNVLYLKMLNKEVIACDYSNEALKIIKKHFPNIQTKKFNMLDGLPFINSFTNIIIADLSLHYFHENSTRKIIKEINRVLKKGGYLIFRVNSINDINYGALQGVKLEKNFFNINGEFKRFFNINDLKYFFTNWEIIDLVEEKMTRYEKPKILWRGLVRKR